LNPRRPTTHRWPFWLLIAAWFCANSPQTATYALLAWLGEARTFSHQQQLSRDVAHLLGGETAPSRVAAVMARAKADEGALVKLPSSVPASAVLKKIDLSVESVPGFNEPPATAIKRSGLTVGWSDCLRAPPPHGPPRARA